MVWLYLFMRCGNEVSKDRALPDILGITATSLSAWSRCPRLYLNSYVLGTPRSDSSGSPDFGTFVHALMHRIHTSGSCHDADHVRDVLESYGADTGVVPSMIERHAQRCPSESAIMGKHEHQLARFHPGAPRFIASGRLDAIWRLDGVLEVRDYKTGGKATERVADDERARLQAWLVAPIASRLNLSLRIRYEHLAAEIDDEPDIFEPGDEELEEIQEEICATVTAIRVAGQNLTRDGLNRDGFRGVSDPAICGYCDYRSLCPDSAAPGVPTWPEPPEEDLT